MNTDRCGYSKPLGTFVSVLLALIVHSMLWPLVLVAYFWFSARPTSGHLPQRWRQSETSACQRGYQRSYTDGRTGCVYRW